MEQQNIKSSKDYDDYMKHFHISCLLYTSDAADE